MPSQADPSENGQRVAVERRFPPVLVWVGLVALVLVGAAVVLAATPWGAGLGGDSYYYVSGARNILAGLGFSRPAADGGIRVITHYPPGYSLVLAAMTGLGMDTLDAARWLSALLFGASAGLLAAMVYRSTRSAAPTFLAGLLWLGSPALIVIHTWALSEPLFIFLTLLFLLALARAVEGGRGREIVVAGLLAGLTYLTRYVGLAVIATGGLALLTFGQGPVRRRVGAAAGFGAISVLLPAAWAARNFMASGSLAYHAQQLHPPSLERLADAAVTVSRWVLPDRVPVLLRAGVAGLAAVSLGILTVRLFRRGGGTTPNRRLAAQAGVLLCLAVVYPLSLLGAITLVGASVPLDDRILSPLLLALIGLGTLTGWDLIQSARGRGLLRGGMVVLALGFLTLTLLRGVGSIRQLRADGQGEAARAWQESQLVDWVRGLPEGVPIYSNELDVLYLYTGRQAYQVPIRWDPVQEAPREDYPAQLASMRDRILHQAGVLVLFDSLSAQQAFLPTEEELSQGLVAVFRAEDGTVYTAPR